MAVIDNDSTSALVRFVKESKNVDMSPIIGVTLTVYSEQRQQIVLEERNKKAFSFLYSLEVENVKFFSYSNLSRLKEYLLMMKTSINEPTKEKLSKAISKFSDYLDENQMKSLKEINLKGREYQTLLALSQALVIDKGVSSYLSQGNLIHFLNTVMSIDFNVESGKLVFIPKNEVGYKNILILASLKSIAKNKNIENNLDLPLAVTLEQIKEYREGVVVVDPYVDFSFLGGVSEDARFKLEEDSREFIDYIGVPYNSHGVDYLKEQSKLPRIAFPIAHYAKEDEYESYCVKVAIQRDQLVNDFTFEKPNKESYIHNYDDVESYFKKQIDNGLSIDLSFWDENIEPTKVSLGEVHLPSYDMPVKDVIEHGFNFFSKKSNCSFESEEEAILEFDKWLKESIPEGKSPLEYRQQKLNDYCMHMITMDGLDERLIVEYGEDAESHRQEYLDRIAYEFGVIESMGFAGYFLIEYDFVSYARKIGVPVGPGRGSAAGSLIVYCMEITDVDPIVYGLQFERFLNPERVSMPDIDVDFGSDGKVNRDSVLRYIREKHQKRGTTLPSSSQIANIMRYQVKSSIQVVRKAYGLSMSFDKSLKLLIKKAEDELGISAPANISWGELLSVDFVVKRMKKEPMLKKVLLIAKELTGKMSGYGVHAGGVVISPTVVTDFTSIACDDNGNFFSQLDKDDVESVGLIKFDVLGLRTLSVIAECVNQIEKNTGKRIDVRKIDTFDPTVYELICEQSLADVFQLESSGMRDLVGNLRPQSVLELGVLSALYRPGALDSGMVEEYIDVKNGLKPPTYDHPSLEKVTTETFGCIVYQEQVMSIVRELAGYSLGQADLLRRAMGKKKVEEMAKQRSVYTLSAMKYWREHYIQVGKKQNFDFCLDVNLSDLKEELSILEIASFLNEDGFLCDMDSVVSILTQLLSLNENNIAQLKKRLGDYDYKTILFKEHYQDSIYSAVEGSLEGARTDECKHRVFFVLSQYVRFNQVFNKVEKFAGYGFNKSHAIAYSLVTYICAYLKRYYPSEFYSAALSFKDLEQLHDTVLEASHKAGVKVLGPEINKSTTLFSVEDGGNIRYGLDKLKGMGKSSVSLLKERSENGPFVSIFDFVYRMSLISGGPNSTGLYALLITGAFDSMLPKQIIYSKKYNGRQYVSFLASNLIKRKQLKLGQMNSKIHESVDEMSDFGFGVYIISILSSASIKKLSFVEDSSENNCVSEAKNKEIISSLTKVLSKKFTESLLNSDIPDEINGLEFDTWFEIHYLRCYLTLKNIAGLDKIIDNILSEELVQPISETLNEEREHAGFYITSTPLKVLRVSERIEREPPSSVIDGCPVPVGKIDNNYDEQSVTTYGIVRGAGIKTIKKADSAYYGVKMFTFTLEDGADTISCSIFGNKPTEAASKLISDGCVAMFSGDVVSSKGFGLTLRVKALKRYFPFVDDVVHAKSLS